MKVNLVVESATAEEKKKIEDAVVLLNKILASDDFKTEVLAHKYPVYKTVKTGWFRSKTTTEWKSGFAGDVSAKYVLDALENGKEVTSETIDKELDLHITMYSKWGKVVGHTTPWESIKIYVNRKFFGGNPIWDVSANFLHEMGHQLGFYHSVPDSQLQYDVAYGLGKIASRVGEKITKQGKLA